MDRCRHTRWWTGRVGCDMQHVDETWSCLFAQDICSYFQFGLALFTQNLRSSQTCLVHDISMENIFLNWLLDLDLSFLSLIWSWGLGTTGEARRFARLLERGIGLWKIGTVRIIWNWAKLSKYVGGRYSSRYPFTAWKHAPISYGRTQWYVVDVCWIFYKAYKDSVCKMGCRVLSDLFVKILTKNISELKPVI